MQEGGPHLPHDLFPYVLAPLVRDVETLCAACCVSKGFRAAAEAHPVWRDLFAHSSAAAAAWRARAARRLDDAGFRALVRRAGAASDAAAAAFATAEDDDVAEPPPWCVDVRNFRRLTARGVVAALGARTVLWLDVGGLRAEPADAAQALLPALRALVTLPRGGLDVDSDSSAANSTALPLCDNQLVGDGSPCARLRLGTLQCEVCKEDEQLQAHAHSRAKIAAMHAAECVPRATETRAAGAIVEHCAACGDEICVVGYCWWESPGRGEQHTCTSPDCGAAFCAACCASGALRGCTSGACSSASSRSGPPTWCRDCVATKCMIPQGA
jgi:hypothetical protein